jgi:hypothetical protein
MNSNPPPNERSADLVSEWTRAKLRLVAQLLARQAAHETSDRAPVQNFNVFGDPNPAAAPVVLGTATCT